jgi:transcription termination/antitermination protein NusA
LRFDVTPRDFGRIAAQTAKQVIVQRIREAEKNVIYAEYKDRVGEILVGSVQRVENKNYLINLGRAEAILYPKDQIPGERFAAKEKVRVYISDVEKGVRGTVIHISRSDSGFLRRLFELEIPEINDGVIEIVGVSRDPGRRAKVAVRSHNPAVGAVGTCVGHMGGRIQSVIKELGYEKIDVLEWSENPRVFIANALKPAKISQVIITDEAQRMATVVVAADQLSLAIGKVGVNVKLAVRLTGWRLDILSEEEYSQKADTIHDQELSIVEKIKKDKDASDAMSFVVPDINDVEVGDDHQLKATELAKILKMKTQDMIDKALSFGIEIESARSVLTPEQVNTIKEKI